MSFYPSLEDMKVDQLMKAQNEDSGQSVQPSAPYPTNFYSKPLSLEYSNLYPVLNDLNDYMGLNLTTPELSLVSPPPYTIEPYNTGNQQGIIAPISGSSAGLQRAQITHGLREVVLCKDAKGKIGLRVKAMSKGVFIVLVIADSPASMVGLRFGDQILEINGENVAGYSMDKVHEILRKTSTNNIRLIVRDRPFERTITLHKDSTGVTGFTFKNGKINAIVKDSSAARNGLLIDHNLLEVNGQNVVGINDKKIRNIIEEGENVITLTVMPSSIYEHMMKQMASSLVKKLMDHSIPEI